MIANEKTDANAHLFKAFDLAKGKLDGFIARTLFLRAALAALNGEDARPFLGQFKMLLEKKIRPAPSRNTSVREHLRQHLPPDRFGLFDALYKVLNLEPGGIALLDALTEWQKAVPVPLESPWPDTP